jgi:hypothetical protein
MTVETDHFLQHGPIIKRTKYGTLLQRDEPSLDNTECQGPTFYSEPYTVFFPIPIGLRTRRRATSLPWTTLYTWSKIYEDPVGPYSCGNPNDLRGRGEGGGGEGRSDSWVLSVYRATDS